MNCGHCGQHVEEGGISRTHHFAGHMYFVVYHPECCPRELDGMKCELEHPEPQAVPPRTPAHR
jgi:hypothetical protein